MEEFRVSSIPEVLAQAARQVAQLKTKMRDLQEGLRNKEVPWREYL
jgi:hypothetical protein